MSCSCGYYLSLENFVEVSGGTPGPTGEQGPQGPTGPNGPQGPTGDQGDPGPTGSQGGIGPTGGVGPIGPTGTQGDPGGQGIAGPTGIVGITGGIGPTGPQGPIGPTGSQGIPGPTGADSTPPIGSSSVTVTGGAIKLADIFSSGVGSYCGALDIIINTGLLAQAQRTSTFNVMWTQSQSLLGSTANAIMANNLVAGYVFSNPNAILDPSNGTVRVIAEGFYNLSCYGFFPTGTGNYRYLAITILSQASPSATLVRVAATRDVQNSIPSDLSCSAMYRLSVFDTLNFTAWQDGATLAECVFCCSVTYMRI